MRNMKVLYAHICAIKNRSVVNLALVNSWYWLFEGFFELLTGSIFHWIIAAVKKWCYSYMGSCCSSVFFVLPLAQETLMLFLMLNLNYQKAFFTFQSLALKRMYLEINTEKILLKPESWANNSNYLDLFFFLGIWDRILL